MEKSEICPDTEKLSFGEVLKEARLEKRLTIDDIVSETRISKQVIDQMETVGSTDLPEPVFLKGFIKSYAELVGLDPEEIIGIYKDEYGIEDKPNNNIGNNVTPSSALSETEPSKLPYGIAAALIIIAVLLVLGVSSKNADNDNPSQSQPDIQNTVPGKSAAGSEKSLKDYRLEVVCIEETLLKISIDGDNVAEYRMMPEDHLELKASKRFNILINNTCGVTLFLNNNPVEIPGKCGQTANVHLPMK